MAITEGERGCLITHIRDVITQLQQRWVGGRGIRISAELMRYRDAGLFHIEESVDPKSAGWTRAGVIRSGRITVYIQRDQRGATSYGAGGRAFHPQTNPGGWIVCDLCYVNRKDLITSLGHEGLHAAQNLSDSPLEEEVDGRLAGNAALRAILGAGHPVSQPVGRDLAGSLKLIAPDYPELKSDSTYTPLGGSWPNPWTEAF